MYTGKEVRRTISLVLNTVSFFLNNAFNDKSLKKNKLYSSFFAERVP